MIITSTLLLAAAALTGRLPAQQGTGRATDKDEARCRLGLRAIQVAEVPVGNLFGSRSGWLTDTSFAIEQNVHGLEIKVANTTLYTMDSLEFLWASDFLTVSAQSFSCTDIWTQPSLAGTACVLTDGTHVSLEFEVYDGINAEYAKAYFGRISLGDRALPSVQSLLGLQEKALEPDVREMRMTITRPDYSAAGYHDAFGRRQGLWFVARKDGDLAMHWRNGIPDGPYQFRAKTTTEASMGTFLLGFQSGTTIGKTRDGNCTIESWLEGELHGNRIVYGHDGRKLEQMTYTHGIASSGMTRWLANDQMVEVVYPLSVAFKSAEARRTFLKDLEGFQTRQ